MQVQKYLRQFGIQKLQEEYFIKVREYDEGLLVLNYDQILSPKSHPIVMECRGLILDKNFDVVSRSFDRFFNLGEAPETQAHLDWSKAVCAQKVDGSLIRLYFWQGKWHIATRGMAFAEGSPNGFDITFRGLVLKALLATEQEFQTMGTEILNPDITYICEITSTENRCVKSYSGYTLHYLAARNNKTFEYVSAIHEAVILGMSIPEKYLFSSGAACKMMADNLTELDEGFVAYQDGIPVAKIKSSAYVAVHHIRGEGLSPKRISELVLTGEQDEYLLYFPEDRHFIQPYVDELARIKSDLEVAYSTYSGVESQKDFAISIKSVKANSVLFYARKMKTTISEAWEAQTPAFKLRCLMEEAADSANSTLNFVFPD